MKARKDAFLFRAEFRVSPARRRMEGASSVALKMVAR